MISSSSFASFEIVIESKIALVASSALFSPRVNTLLGLSNCCCNVFVARPLLVCGKANKPNGDPRASTFIVMNVTRKVRATQTCSCD